MITGYYQFISLSDEVKALNKIRSKARLDCIKYSGNYGGLTFFVNKQNQLSVYKVPTKEIIQVNSKRIAEWALSNNNLNLSSIFIENLDFPEYGFGYPNKNPYIGIQKRLNPLFDYRNDAYLFILNKDYSSIELLVIQDGRNTISSYYQMLIDGILDLEIDALRTCAKPYAEYIGLSYSNL